MRDACRGTWSLKTVLIGFDVGDRLTVTSRCTERSVGGVDGGGIGGLAWSMEGAGAVVHGRCWNEAGLKRCGCLMRYCFRMLV